METKDKNYILFAPVGTSDPARGFRDGPIMQIIRHYQPQKVLLYYTSEMKIRHEVLTQAIQKISDCKIEPPIYTDITKANDYDIFINSIPAYVNQYREENPDATLLLNLTSGTTQIQTVMSILATQLPNTIGVQVDTPNKSSNQSDHPIDDMEEMKIQIELNQDNENSTDRTHEPALQVLRRYALRNQVRSLTRNKEYQGALQIVNQNPIHFHQDTKKLLQHAVYRNQMCLKKSRETLAKYQGKNLFPIEDATVQKFTEYYLIMQNRQEKAQLADFIVKISPFLQEIFEYYLFKQCKSLQIKSIIYETQDKHTQQKKYTLRMDHVSQNHPGLYSQFRQEFGTPRDTELSPRNMKIICQYIQENNLADNYTTHQQINETLKKLPQEIFNLRNSVAHLIVEDMDETKFRKTTKMTSHDTIQILYTLINLIVGEKMGRFRNIYETLNQLIEDSLQITDPNTKPQ